MAEPTLTDIFGAGATQTDTTITILKADLPLTSSPLNRAEQLFAGILKKASTVLTTTAAASNIDQSITLQTGFDSIAYRTVNNVQAAYLQNQLTVTFSKTQNSAGINPDDY